MISWSSAKLIDSSKPLRWRKTGVLKPNMAPKPAGIVRRRLASRATLMRVDKAASWGWVESGLVQVVKISAGVLLSLYLMPSKKKLGRRVAAFCLRRGKV